MAKKINLNKDIEQITKAIFRQTKAVDKNTKAMDVNTASRISSQQTMENIAGVLLKQTAALESLTATLNKNTGAQARNRKQGVFGVKTNRLLAGSFATLRSQLLLVSFGYLMLKRTVGALIKEHSDFEGSVARINQGLRTTGRFAQSTSAQMLAIADALQESTGVAGTQINEIVGLGLTFTNISTKTMPEFTKAVLDMTAGMNAGVINAEQLKSNSIVLGKALNDPIQGISALTRVGVQFTQAQKDQIKGMVTFGDLAGAQKIILEEINKQFKDKASLDTYEKSMRDLNVAFDDLKRAIGEDLAPHLEKLADLLTEFIKETDAEDVYDFGNRLIWAGGSALVFQQGLSGLLTQAANGKLTFTAMKEAVASWVFNLDDGNKVVKKTTWWKKSLLWVVRRLKGRFGFLGLVGSLTGLSYWFEDTTNKTKKLNDELLKTIENSGKINAPTSFVAEPTTISGQAGIISDTEVIEKQIQSLQKKIEALRENEANLQERIEETNKVIRLATGDTNEYIDEIKMMATVLGMVAQAQEPFGQSILLSSPSPGIQSLYGAIMQGIESTDEDMTELREFISNFTFMQWGPDGKNVTKWLDAWLQTIENESHRWEEGTIDALHRMSSEIEHAAGDVGKLKKDKEFQEDLQFVQAQLDKLHEAGLDNLDVISRLGAETINWLSFGLSGIADATDPMEDAGGRLVDGIRASNRMTLAMQIYLEQLQKEKENLEENQASRQDLINAKQKEIDQINEYIKEIAKLKQQLDELNNVTNNQVQIQGKVNKTLQGTLHFYDQITNDALVGYVEKLRTVNTLHGHQVDNFENALLPVVLKYVGAIEAASGKKLINQDGLYDTVAILKQFQEYATLDKDDLDAIDKFAERWGHSAEEIKKAVLEGKQIEVIQATLKKDASEEDITTWAETFGLDIDELKQKLDALPAGGNLVEAITDEDATLLVTYNKHFAELLAMFQQMWANKPRSIFDDIAEAMNMQKDILKEYIDLMFDVANAITNVIQMKIDMERATIDNTHAERMEIISSIRNQAVRELYEKKAREQKEAEEAELFEKHKKNQIAMAWIAGAQGIMNVLMEPAPQGMDTVTASIIRGIQIGLITGTTAAQVAQIKSQKSFARGGFVSGPLHSGGGVDANLEGGEFVMNRSAVKDIGHEALEELNRGGKISGDGGVVVNVTFQGNVNSSDFIEDEVIPTIQDAISRGVILGDS